MKWIATLIVAVVAACLVAENTSPCPPGFVDLGVNSSAPECLAFILEMGTWELMDHWCSGLEANMSKIATDDFHNRVYNYIINTPGLAGHCFWIGGTDQDEEGSWIWEADGTEVAGGLNWDPCTGDPNGSTDENYLCLCPDDYYFRDCNNDDWYYGICQL